MTDTRLDGLPRGCGQVFRPDGPRGIVYGCLRVYGHEPPCYQGNHCARIGAKNGKFVLLGHDCDKACEIHKKP